MLGMKGNRENKQKSIVTYMKIESDNSGTMEAEWNKAKLDVLWPQVIYQCKNIFFKVLSKMII